MSKRLVLWRHGRTDWNVEGRVQGQTDTDLDDVGREQARAAAARLASLAPQRIISSDLRRAHDTAKALAAVVEADVELDPRLREMDFGAREGLTWREAWTQLPEGMRAWIDGDETKIPGSETHLEAGDRAAPVLREVGESLPDGGLAVIVAHGAILRTGICRFLGFPRESWTLFSGLSNCSWTVLEQSHPEHDSRWRLVEWNAGTLPEPVTSDDEPPGLSLTDTTG
ncbi:MAG: histidine phosphatase family protein [Actinomycetales bacterium]|nr:MAG: histidine phosphatase family protein [Actinomycetales bacterium]